MTGPSVPTWQFKRLRLYPLVCMHIGAPQCDLKFLTKHIQRIKEDEDARWVYMGDGGECVTKHSKGDVYGQLIAPQAQLDMLVELLHPIRDKGLFGIRGNHGHRVYKETGLSFDHTLCSNKNLAIPYLGVAAFARFLVGRSHYSAYFHHGVDSGVSLRSKISAAEKFNDHIIADSIYTAHSHVAEDLTPAPYQQVESSGNGTFFVATRLRHQYICGTAYDSRTGYAEDKGYKPLLPAYLSVEYDGRIIEGYPQYSQNVQKYRSTADYKLEHWSYLKKYLDPEWREE